MTNCIYYKLIYWQVIILFSCVCFFSITALAYDDQITHPDITEKALENSNLNDYLIDRLGVSEGIDKTFTYLSKTNTILELIRKGSIEEDLPMCRASNHFHNPLMPWDQSYLTDRPLLLDTFCFNWIPPYSNITWATGYLSQPPGGSKASFPSPESPINWDIARDNYYSALTSSLSNRDYYFITTFETLGHVLHLLEDVSVPAHVRNDFTSHLTFNGIVSWNPTDWYIQPYEYYVKNNPLLIRNAQLEPPSFINPKLTDFWDTDQYDGTNPDATEPFGLAEITNATYFSDSTILNNNPSPEHYFPYPNVSNTDYQICNGLSPDGVDYVRYISRKSKGPCPPVHETNNIDHFAVVSLLEKESDIVGLPISQLKLWLDDNVHNDYAEELIPRAVGYSAELLNYFFRGDIDLVEDTITGSGYVIVNNSEEDMDGAFEIYYDNVNDERILLWSSNLTLDTLSSGNNKSSNISLTVPSDAKVYGNFILVFRGRLGNETDAVVGKVIEHHNLAIFLRLGGVIKRCLTTYKDLMNEVQCSLEVANNIYGGPTIYNTDWFNNRIAQKAFRHNGQKIYLIHMGIDGTYLYDPIRKQFFFLHTDNTFFNASGQYIYVLEFYDNRNIYVFNYTGSGLIQTGIYPSVPSTDYFFMEYVSQNGESYIRDTQLTESIPCTSSNCTKYRKYYKYNIFTGGITEIGNQYYEEKTTSSTGMTTYNYVYIEAPLFSHKSTANGVDLVIEPYTYTYNEATTRDGSGNTSTTITINEILSGDSYNTIANCSNTLPDITFYQWTGNRIDDLSNIDAFSIINNYTGLLTPDNSNLSYLSYDRFVADGTEHYNGDPGNCQSPEIAEIISKVRTPYEVFESTTHYLSATTTFHAEDRAGRDFSISGFLMNHQLHDYSGSFDTLVLYDHNGMRIDQKMLNILRISDPTLIRGIFLLD